MQFVTDILVAIISGYLALTGSLAQFLLNLLPETETATIETVAVDHQEPAKETIDILSSDYERGGTIPDILVQNASYQQAAVVESQSDDEIQRTTTQHSVEDALVNIFCTFTTPEYTKSNSGTGFFINDDGVIMTNAHIAQFLLLETIDTAGDTDCIIRTGSPATARYEVELLYISPAWIQKHAELIDDPRPRGTGERDFALLYVTGGLNNQPLPAHFPHLPLATGLLSKDLIGGEIIAAGYPAERLITEGREYPLSPVSATTSLLDMYTFGSNYADVFSIADSPVGEFGASGGPILDTNGNVIGLITTKSTIEDGLRSLRAITLSYIDRTIIEESTFDLANTASGQLAFRAQLFMDTIVPFLSRLLEIELTEEETT